MVGITLIFNWLSSSEIDLPITIDLHISVQNPIKSDLSTRDKIKLIISTWFVCCNKLIKVSKSLIEHETLNLLINKYGGLQLWWKKMI